MGDYIPKTCPEKRGRLDVFPEIAEGSVLKVCIIGDPDGLKYLADLLYYLADFDQSENSDPIGEREHIHLYGELQLGGHSCEVELCRADAKGTGEIPDYMR
ncbi:MAG: hypothetical protein IH624_17290 [Phycisphaerae bacterium]|nr:hypothetical protein [Phycisphaerae bacterium]